MTGYVFGNKFKVKVFGGSHDAKMILEIHGLPKNIFFSEKIIADDLSRRRPSFDFDTPRVENDEYRIIGGVDGCITNSLPIVIEVLNKEQDSYPYNSYKHAYRPSHVDFVYEKKYGIPLPSGSGLFSARETVLRVIAGAVAKMYIKSVFNDDIKFFSWTYSVGNLIQDSFSLSLNDNIKDYLSSIRKEGDSIGGRVRCIIKGLPAGIGEPVFNKLHALLSFAIMSIPAAKSFEIGKGIDATTMKGSEFNDTYGFVNNMIKPTKNDAGGLLGGITTGEDLVITVGFKPISSIAKTQHTVDKYGNDCELKITGKHDVCAAVRSPIIVEAMSAIVIADMLL